MNLISLKIEDFTQEPWDESDLLPDLHTTTEAVARLECLMAEMYMRNVSLIHKNLWVGVGF
jgi:hypothetical protein